MSQVYPAQHYASPVPVDASYFDEPQSKCRDTDYFALGHGSASDSFKMHTPNNVHQADAFLNSAALTHANTAFHQEESMSTISELREGHVHDNQYPQPYPTSSIPSTSTPSYYASTTCFPSKGGEYTPTHESPTTHISLARSLSTNGEFESAQARDLLVCKWKGCHALIKNDVSALKDHAKVHGASLNDLRKIECGCYPLCHRAPVSLQARNLAIHYVNEMGVRYQCSVCGLTGTRPDALRRQHDNPKRLAIGKHKAERTEIMTLLPA